MNKINLMLRRCKTISSQLVKTSSYSTLIRSKSNTDHGSESSPPTFMWNTTVVSVYTTGEIEPHQIVFVGSTRKRYVIASKYLTHPLVNALIQKSTSNDNNNVVSVINCEVVLFDHLLWMLQNSDFNLTSDSLDELADLYLS
ncbi:Auxin responsive SAUR protein [Cynara cardunculus var. scolymus]|uniref:Auxin responsive SAUR protein n=1 Tax=Cynara cardunculus var. scolymus TaxID=59895 RepID=A0A118K1E3_CYNCS|nr:Auxin responsive SAUR protein [Cynara cardunculus var. scolymus]